MRKTLVAAALLLAAGCSSTPPAPPAPAEFTLTGSLTMTNLFSDCIGLGGDIKPGASVTVYDDAGKIVAAGSLGTGEFTRTNPNDFNRGTCRWPVSVPAVAVGPKFYQVEISHQRKLTVSAADAQSGALAVTLGT